MDISATIHFDVTTSIRSDSILREAKGFSPNHSDSKACQFYMLDKHQDRILAAISAFKWPKALRGEISKLQEHLLAHVNSTYRDATGRPLKIRVTLSCTGDMKITSVPVPIVGVESLFPPFLSDLLEPLPNGVPPSFRIFVSPVLTTPDQFTAHKTTRRASYDDVRSFLPVHPLSSSDTTPPPEIILINHDYEIMEGSITTPYFFRGGEWITPAACCGGNLGTTRRHALERGLCNEGVVMKTSVHPGEKVVLSNGVRGFGWGSIEELPMLQE